LNATLPGDIAVLDAQDAPPGFHARRSAVGRWYRYTIWRGTVRNVWWQRYSLHARKPLDVGAMRRATGLLEGNHDFRAFATGARPSPSSRRGTVRCVYRADWTECRDFLYVDIRADGFLRQMARGIVGTLLWVGRGRIPPERIGTLLAGADRAEAGPNAPALGLTLMHVEYEGVEQLLNATAPSSTGFWPIVPSANEVTIGSTHKG
jgi:tRNA pseudouridine38-40 synthase